MKTTIYVACHKPCWLPEHADYVPLHVGAAGSTFSINGRRDDEGISISEKNPTYCELTGMYWIWKNDTRSDIVGLCHYRRYFGFEEMQRPFYRFPVMQVSTASKNYESYVTKVIEPGKVASYLEKNDIILPVNMRFPISLEQQYCKSHISSDWTTMKNVIASISSDYTDSMKKVFSSHWFYPYNMFIMKRTLFNTYMNWLFAVMERLEGKIEISSDPYQKRVLGFIGERLLTLFVFHKQLKIQEVPVVFIDENRTTLLRERKNLKYLASQMQKKLTESR